MLLELAIRYGNKVILEHILEYHVESRDDGRWLRDVYDGSYASNYFLEVDDYKVSDLSEPALKLIKDYCIHIHIKNGDWEAK